MLVLFGMKVRLEHSCCKMAWESSLHVPVSQGSVNARSQLAFVRGQLHVHMSCLVTTKP